MSGEITRSVMRKKIFIIVLALVLSAIASRIFTLREGVLDRAISYITYPLLVIEAKITQPLRRFFEKRAALEYIFALYQAKITDNEALRAENIQLHSLLHEARCFDELVQFKQRYHSAYAHPARVLEKQLDDRAQFFLIDKGAQQGITTDMIAVYKNMLVGRVTQVLSYYSKVVLYTDTQSKVPALCTTTGAQGIHEGLNSTRETRLSFVSHLEDILPDDLVVTRGEGLIYPKGFALGRIKSFEKQGLQYHITVEPLIDLSSINEVYIIQKGSEYTV